MLNIVSGFHTIQKFQSSQFFRKNLGLVATVEKNGSRTYNENDKFANYYNNTYRTTIYGQGNIADIRFYTDHYIKDDTIAAYYGNTFEEFLFTWDEQFVKEKGIDSYIGKILKESEERYEEKKKADELKKLEPKPIGNPDKLTMNPGQVSYDDIKEYLKQKRSNI